MLVSQDCIEKRGEFVGSACGPKGPYVPDVLFWCVILFFSTVIMSAFLKEFKFSNYFPTKVRAVIHAQGKKKKQKLQIKAVEYQSSRSATCWQHVKSTVMHSSVQIWVLHDI